MPEEKLSKTGRRGAYSESSVRLEKDQQGNWVAQKQPKPKELTAVDTRRNRLSSQINVSRSELVKEVKRRNSNLSDKDAIRIVNGEVYETKGRRHYRFSPSGSEQLEHARRLYKQRVPLDERSRELRKNEDNSFRKLYDKVRDAKKQRRSGIYIDGQEVPLVKIKEVRDSNKKVTGYSIGSDVIRKYGNATTVTVSVFKRPKIVVQKEKIVGRKPTNRITFTREGTELVTNSNIGLLLDNAYKQTGVRLIYLNNAPFNEGDFYKGADGRWRIQPFAVNELNAPEVEDKISVRYSYLYQPRERILQARVETGTPVKAEERTYGEIASRTNIGGRDVDITIEVQSVDAVICLKNSRKLEGAASLVSTDFKVEKVGDKYVIKVGATIGGQTPTNNENLEQYYGRDEFLIITWYKDKERNVWQYIVNVKSPVLTISSNISDWNNQSP
jgi:hypothetical protein